MRSARPASIALTTSLAVAALVVALGVATAPAQEASTASAAPEATPAPPRVIPVPEIATRAEETTARLRTLEETLRKTEEVSRIADALGPFTERLKQRRRTHDLALDSGPTLRALSQMTATWQGDRAQLASWNEVLVRYATQSEKQIEELDGLVDLWSASLEQARESNAPSPVIERVQETLAAIRRARREVESHRAEILSLQDRVVRAIASCDEAIYDITTYRKEEVGRILVRNAEPLLGALRSSPREPGEMAVAIRNSLRDELAALPPFLQQAGPSLLFQGALLVALVVVFRRAHARTRTWLEQDSALERAAHIFAFPYSSAFLVTASTSNLLYPWAPHMVNQIIGVLTLIPLTRIVRALIDQRLVPAVWAFAIFFLLDRVRDLVASVPPIEHAILLAELAAGIAVVGWMIRSHRFDDVDDDHAPSTLQRMLRYAAWLVVLLLAVALASGLLGYMRLAHVLGAGVLTSVYLAAALFACARALDGLVAYALRAWPLRMLRMVRRHRPMLQARAWRLLIGLAVVTWAVAVAHLFELVEPVVTWVLAILRAQLPLGELTVSIGDVLAFLLMVWLSLVLSRLLRFILEEDVYPQIALPRGVPYAISSLVHYVVLIGGSLLALAAMGLDLNRFTILAGALGVGVGFGLQNVVNNFVSGLILLFERPIQVGDTVSINNLVGEVRRIGIRSSTVRTTDGAEVIVPNANLIAQPVTNWTLTDKLHRIDVPVRVALGYDPDDVIALLRGVVAETPRIAVLPAPEVLFGGFGDSSLDFTVHAWTEQPEKVDAIRSELALRVYRALHDAGLLPPHRDVPVPQEDAEEDASHGDGPGDGDVTR
ncbi:MAG TPA: mechanosensitive ion channel domain-containing protein [Candidatus Binatia bacterium]